MGGGGGNDTITAVFVVGGSVVDLCAGTDVSLFCAGTSVSLLCAGSDDTPFCAGTGISPFTLYTSGTLEDSLTILFFEGTVFSTCELCFHSRRGTGCGIDVSVVFVGLEWITVGSAEI